MCLRINFDAKLNLFKVAKINDKHINSTGEVCHETNSENFEHLPRNRILAPEDKKEVVRLKALGADSKKIITEIRAKTGKKIQLKDVHNIVGQSKIPKAVTEFADNLEMGSLDEAIQKQIAEDGKDNFQFAFDETETKLYIMFYQTDEMRELYQHYGDILFIDGTYRVNINNYSIYLFVVEDNNGNSQVVGSALTVYEREVCLETIVNFFISQVNIEHTKAIMTDKDLTEQDVLQRLFPGATLLLCKFHVIKTFKEKCKNKKLLEVMNKMINSKVTGRGRPKYAKNKKDIDPTQPTTSQLAENRDALDLKLLALVIISPQCGLPFDEENVKVTFGKMYPAKKKQVMEFKKQVTRLQRFFTVDGLTSLNSLLNTCV